VEAFRATECVIGSTITLSGQRSRLLLRRSEFKSSWLLIVFIMFEMVIINTIEAGEVFKILF